MATAVHFINNGWSPRRRIGDRRRLNAERVTELDGYYLAQSRLLLVCWACLMLVGLGLWVSAGRTRLTSLLRSNPALQQSAGA